MKDEKIIRYEKPLMSAYRFLCPVDGDGGNSPGGDIPVPCDESGWDDEN